MSETSHMEAAPDALHDVAHHGAAIGWDSVLEWGLTLLSGGLILIGVFFVLAGALGLLRMPDFYTRMHAAGMTDTLGAEFILMGLMVQSGFSQMTFKLLLVAFFLFVTSPAASHAIANAAHKSGLKPKLGLYKAPSINEIDEHGSA
ncbi:MAG: monovalent cation/H(+) antiporter subunit G [Robiginitomaculum sp.]